MTASSPFREKLPDGSRIERNFRLVGGERVAYGSWYWTVYDPTRTPARHRTNLRTEDKAAAMSAAAKLAGARSLGTFNPRTDPTPRPGVTLAAAVDEYHAERLRTVRATTADADRRTLDRFTRALHPGALVGHADRRHVEGFLTRPKEQGRGTKGAARRADPRAGERAATSIARYLATLRHFFAWAVSRGYITASPATLTAPKGGGKGNGRRDHITEDEAAALLRAVGADEVLHGRSYGWLRDWVAFGLATGLRPGEQRELRWSAVRLSERAVEVGRGHHVKTSKSRRTVPLPAVALEVLQRRAAARTAERDGPVFAAPRGGLVNLRFLLGRLEHYAAASGVQKNVTTYSLRHAYGTRMALAGTPLYILAQLMGTSVAMVERHYGHYHPEAGAAHVQRVFNAPAAPSAGPSRLAARRRSAAAAGLRRRRSPAGA